MKNCVYRFVNENNEIIYIGKAKDLRNRINTHNHLPKECYEERTRIEYTSFETETDMDFAERY
jgi:excinuclease UvrABC nuclease subunit